MLWTSQNGHIAWLQYDLEDTEAPVYSAISGDIAERIRHVKKLVELEEAPDFCNEKGSGWQKWKYEVKRRLFLLSVQAFMLSRTAYFSLLRWPKVLTEVVNEPKVQEIF